MIDSPRSNSILMVYHDKRFFFCFFWMADHGIGQALSGAALSGKKEYDHAEALVITPTEHASLTKLSANWRAVVEQEELFG